MSRARYGSVSVRLEVAVGTLRKQAVVDALEASKRLLLPVSFSWACDDRNGRACMLEWWVWPIDDAEESDAGLVKLIEVCSGRKVAV